MNLSKNFSLAELTRSQYATRHDIRNEPLPVHIDNLQRLCELVLQPIRDEFGPVRVSSGYRCDKLNRCIGGAPHSAHVSGRAADIIVPGHDTVTVCEWALRNTLADKAIQEFDGWSHLQIAHADEQPRGAAYTAFRFEGRTHYMPGIMLASEARALL